MRRRRSSSFSSCTSKWKGRISVALSTALLIMTSLLGASPRLVPPEFCETFALRPPYCTRGLPGLAPPVSRIVRGSFSQALRVLMNLLGRRAECEAIDGLLTDVLAGRSRVAVLRGEAGIGKSALLGYLSDRVAGWRVVSAVGVESEMELAYSGLHQLCAPLLDHLDELPPPQRDALATVFGLSAGPAPDRFLVGLAALTLVAQAAEQQPLACIIDDAQWLDQASAQLLGFVARRLLAERVALVCAARAGIGDGVLAGLPALEIGGLGYSDARPLLLRSVHGPIDAAVTDRIIAESRGNP